MVALIAYSLNNLLVFAYINQLAMECAVVVKSAIFSESELVVFRISMSEEAVAISCKLNGLANNCNVLCLST